MQSATMSPVRPPHVSFPLPTSHAQDRTVSPSHVEAVVPTHVEPEVLHTSRAVALTQPGVRPGRLNSVGLALHGAAVQIRETRQSIYNRITGDTRPVPTIPVDLEAGDHAVQGMRLGAVAIGAEIGGVFGAATLPITAVVLGILALVPSDPFDHRNVTAGVLLIVLGLAGVGELVGFVAGAIPGAVIGGMVGCLVAPLVH